MPSYVEQLQCKPLRLQALLVLGGLQHVHVADFKTLPCLRPCGADAASATSEKHFRSPAAFKMKTFENGVRDLRNVLGTESST